MVSAEINWSKIDETKTDAVRRVDLGRPGTDSIPDVICLLTLDGVASLSVRLHRNSDESYTFRDARFWRGFLIVGWGDAFNVINVNNLYIHRQALDTYFGYIHADPDVLLIASAERVIRLKSDGSIAWKSDIVGIDGVMFTDVDAQFVTGDGEWDPPGDWKPFRLRTANGARV